jgi:excinuclease ABC subunit C
MVIRKALAAKIATAPQVPGVYIFKDRAGVVLYVGKAINLRKRLQYYAKDRKDLYAKTALFLEKTERLNWIVVNSELESLLLEMNLIRSLKPKYNAASKDDKRPLLVHISNDRYPRVRTARIEIPGTGDYFGPFPSSQKLRIIMKRLRRIFPYCSCTTHRKTPCMYADLGLCDPSPAAITTAEDARQYRKNITRLKLFLGGKISNVIAVLKKEMKGYSEKFEFEKAQKAKEQIQAIEELLVSSHSISEYLKDTLVRDHLRKAQNDNLAQFLGLSSVERIEGYDVANTAGTNPTASMVVFTNGIPDSSEYRKFKITMIKGANDPLMMYHTLTRRFNHPEWDKPNVILVDGGKTQVRAALKAIEESGLKIKVIGLAKRLEQIILPTKEGFSVQTPPLDSPFLTLLRAVRDEAHRFTTNYHKKLRQKEMFNHKL